MPEAVVNVQGRPTPLRIRLDGPARTFTLATDTIRAAAAAELDPLHLDLLEIAATVFAADGSVKRGGKTRPHMGTGWRRDFEFTIPVRIPAFWNGEEVRQALTDAVAFMLDETVTFQFVPKQHVEPAEPFLQFDPESGSFQADEVILFSGGLDSYAGALETLASTASKVILLTHRSAQKAIPRQTELGKELSESFSGRVLHINVLARRHGQEANDTTQRSRTLLFAALGQLVAKSFGASRVSFYENGVISHNLPISSQVVGSMATRTTHPLTLTRLDRLLQTLGSDHVALENRYKWLTKRDVLERIRQHGGEDLIPKTVSCTSIREQTTRHTHCGTCSQCLDRRFAVLAAGLERFDFEEDYATDILLGERDDTASRTMAAEWTRHALQLKNLDERAFMARFGLELSRIVEGHPDLSVQEVVERSLIMHKHHGESVSGVLVKAVQAKSEELVQGTIPPSSLLRLVIGQTGVSAPPQLSDPRAIFDATPTIPAPEEVDITADPSAPLVVEFLEENGTEIVAVEGLCRVTRTAAAIPFALRPVFEEDKADGMVPEDHRYVDSGELARTRMVSKSAVRQMVRRCRSALKESFEQIHEMAPDRDLLIQNKTAKGYRLDPTIVIRSAPDS